MLLGLSTSSNIYSFGTLSKINTPCYSALLDNCETNPALWHSNIIDDRTVTNKKYVCLCRTDIGMIHNMRARALMPLSQHYMLHR
jgi:hypothetical protein